ncbi:hypothetical protein P9112_008931 [Eukaryota sp. TZLM1-RC]
MPWCLGANKILDTVGPERVPMLEPHRFEWLGSMAQNTISVSSSGACHSVAFGFWRGLGRSTLACKFPFGFLSAKVSPDNLTRAAFGWGVNVIRTLSPSEDMV